MNYLFVCRANQCRSAMAEVLFKKFARENKLEHEAKSCGTKAAYYGEGAPMTYDAADALSVYDNIASWVQAHHSKQVSRNLVDWADKVIVLDPESRDDLLKWFPNIKSRLLFWDVADPTGDESHGENRFRAHSATAVLLEAWMRLCWLAPAYDPKTPDTPQKILFVCLGNTRRSPMAAALYAHYSRFAGRKDVVASRGISTAKGWPPSPEAVQVVAEQGVNLKNHRSVPLTIGDLHDFDLILALERSIAESIKAGFPIENDCRVFSLGEFMGNPSLDFKDPIGKSIGWYRNMAGVLEYTSEMLAFRLNHPEAIFNGKGEGAMKVHGERMSPRIAAKKIKAGSWDDGVQNERMKNLAAWVKNNFETSLIKDGTRYLNMSSKRLGAEGSPVLVGIPRGKTVSKIILRKGEYGDADPRHLVQENKSGDKIVEVSKDTPEELYEYIKGLVRYAHDHL
ncbi:Protein-tyrosine-phosphatase [Dehalogenimonas alkenigignens]|uniref:Protein-tyrosine-phosphatase n=1 Tax=Dehalogenimonas alkenigignens TaxID=1217799 RepID=A0A0W0GK00_9CHLR|nr:hypothetical protein [Dehalogenimonas alkenigignens]KTB48884.1 Protein-tyrosine-phosphatase [Dehalogenimonas alkenigignens]